MFPRYSDEVLSVYKSLMRTYEVKSESLPTQQGNQTSLEKLCKDKKQKQPDHVNITFLKSSGKS